MQVTDCLDSTESSRIDSHLAARAWRGKQRGSDTSMKSSRERRLAVLAAAAPLFVISLLAAPQSVRADRIVLRNLKTITDRTVISFDEDGLKLDDGSSLTWDEIEKATIAPDKQPAFDILLHEIGSHLYRIRQRLTTGDYEGLLPHAEAVYQRFVKRNSDTAYMVMQAVMWGRLAAGRREAALEPYLRCFELLRSRGGAKVALPGERRLRFDTRTGLTPDLVPVWFDGQAARVALPEVFSRIAEMPRPRPAGVYVYYATLALAAGDDASAAKVLDAIQSEDAVVVELRTIIDAQREILAKDPGVAVAKLAVMSDSVSPSNRALARYWLGRGQLGSPVAEERHGGMLQLLRIPALQGRENPELAAAALFHAMEVLSAEGDLRGSVAVRRELLERYGQTYFATRLKEASDKQTGTEERP